MIQQKPWTRKRPWAPRPPRGLTMAERLMRGVDVEPSGCWRWKLFITPDGYGWLARRKAHQIAYEVFVGPIPKGLELDHLCRVRSCVNPAHLEPVTHAENMRRSAGLKTHCRHGHEYTPENTMLVRNGATRRCWTCVRGVGRSA